MKYRYTLRIRHIGKDSADKVTKKSMLDYEELLEEIGNLKSLICLREGRFPSTYNMEHVASCTIHHREVVEDE